MTLKVTGPSVVWVWRETVIAPTVTGQCLWAELVASVDTVVGRHLTYSSPASQENARAGWAP